MGHNSHMAEYNSGDGRWFVQPTALPTLNFHQFEPHIYFNRAGQYSNYGENVHHLSIVSHDDNGDEMGHIEWHKDRGEILRIHVNEPYRRLGVANTLFLEAKRAAREQGLVGPVHSNDRSDMGDRWAKQTGDPVPRRDTYSDKG